MNCSHTKEGEGLSQNDFIIKYYLFSHNPAGLYVLMFALGTLQIDSPSWYCTFDVLYLELFYLICVSHDICPEGNE